MQPSACYGKPEMVQPLLVTWCATACCVVLVNYPVCGSLLHAVRRARRRFVRHACDALDRFKGSEVQSPRRALHSARLQRHCGKTYTCACLTCAMDGPLFRAVCLMAPLSLVIEHERQS